MSEQPPQEAIEYLLRYLSMIGVSMKGIQPVVVSARTCPTAFWCEDQGLFPGIYVHDLEENHCRRCGMDAAQALAGGWYVCPGNHDHREVFEREQERRSRLGIEAASRCQVRRKVLPYGGHLSMVAGRYATVRVKGRIG